MQFDRIISVRNNRTVFRDGELCIKVLEDDFPASFVLSEATNMVAAAEAGLNVPKLREVNLHGNKRLITYDYIVGSPILCSDRDDADFRAQRLNLLIDAQLSINGTRCPECIRNPRTVPNFRSTGTACTAHDEPNAADIVQIAFNSGKHAAFTGDKLCHGRPCARKCHFIFRRRALYYRLGVRLPGNSGIRCCNMLPYALAHMRRTNGTRIFRALSKA